MNKKKATNNNMLQLSSIILDDSKSVWVDKGKKSVAYFCKNTPVRVNKGLISELKKILTRIGNKNLRLCLHNGPDAPFHEMIIFERKGKYYRPHKHLAKSETFHIIEGNMGVFSFNDDGKVIDVCVLDANDNFIYRVRPNMYHAVMPISDLVIYHESKPGPFTGKRDSIYPSWAPDGNNSEEVKQYTTLLQKTLGI